MPIQLTNTLTRRKDAFVPADPERVTMYVCGPTVYDFAHIGNARSAVVFDVLYRLLKHRFGVVAYARNLTDVDDKITAAALADRVPIEVITARAIEAYHADMAALGVLPPDIEPRVTQHMPAIVTMIERLVARGHAYAAEGHVLFHIPSYPDYGRLAQRTLDAMIAGARIEVAPFKRHPMDFVLWKPSPQDLPGWPSPWGRGRPGWHIECSAMIEQHLGPSIDLHGGGQDLIFPHHENEIAQGTCAHDGRLYCRHWVHNGFVTVDGRKMSKSLGNVLLVRDLLGQAPGEVIRLALLSAHYRQPLDWRPDRLIQARRTLDRLYTVLERLEGIVAAPDSGDLLEGFMRAIEDDLNTPAAIAELLRLTRSREHSSHGGDLPRLKASLIRAGSLLGILQQAPQLWLARGMAPDTALIDQLVERRATARTAGDYTTADRLRAELARLGAAVEDRADGSAWRPVR